MKKMIKSDGNGGVICSRAFLITTLIAVIVTCIGGTYTFTTELLGQDTKILERIETKVDKLGDGQLQLKERVARLEAKVDG